MSLLGPTLSSRFTQADVDNAVDKSQSLSALAGVNAATSRSGINNFYGAGFIDEDSSLATITPNTILPGLTKEIRPLENPETYRPNGYLSIQDPGGGVKLWQVDTDGSGIGGNALGGFDCTSAQFTIKTDAQEIAFEVLDNLNGCFKVDGVFVSKTPFSLSGGGFQQVSLAFPSKKVREITICGPRNATVLKKFFVKPTDTIYKPEQGKKVAFIGDSFSVGLTVERAGQHWPDIISDAMGWDNYLVNGISGTGFIAKAAGGDKYNFIERIPQVVGWNPETVIVNVSINDAGYTESELDAAVETFLTSIAASLPNSQIVLIGAIGRSSAGSIFVETVAKNAAEQLSLRNVLFIPSQIKDADGWIFGTGDSGANAGDGNADVYMHSDGIHFTAEGHVYWSERLLQGMLLAGVK